MMPGRVVTRIYVAATARSAGALTRGLGAPRPAQMKILGAILRSNAESDFGRRHRFSSIKDYPEFVRRVPLRDYEDLRDDIERVQRGERGVLTSEAVGFLEPTGGSSGPSKLIPYTRSLKRQIGRAADPWIRDLLVRRPRLRDGRAYWAVSPPARRPQQSSAVPVGAPHDLDYLPRPVAVLMARTLVLPRAVSEIEDLDATRYVTLRALLAAEDLALISVWNPSFLTLLADHLDVHFELLLHDLDRGRVSIDIDPLLRERLERSLPARPEIAARVRRRFGAAAPADLGELWPRLELISCWTDGHAGRAVATMRRRFPRVEVQGKGLLATEGVVSLPLLEHPAPVAAVVSHFLEFLPGDGGDARLLDELEDGRTYEAVITTGGGLYRYRLKDLVRVEGHVRHTPMLRFVGRADAASDICGEKLTPVFVERALARAAARCGIRVPFALLAPRWGDPPRYDLWLELPQSQFARAEAALFGSAVEAELRRAHHYDLCRRLGQLGAVAVKTVADGERAYERACGALGQRAGATKPPALVADLAWCDLFEEVSV